MNENEWRMSQRIDVTTFGDADRYFIPTYGTSAATAENIARMRAESYAMLSPRKCQWCGRKLKPDAEECPRCGGPTE